MWLFDLCAATGLSKEQERGMKYNLVRYTLYIFALMMFLLAVHIVLSF